MMVLIILNLISKIQKIVLEKFKDKNNDQEDEIQIMDNIEEEKQITFESLNITQTNQQRNRNMTK